MNHSIEVYQCSDDHRRAGYWTFRINGEESQFYSSTEEGIGRRLKLLYSGSSDNSIQLNALPANGSPQDSVKGQVTADPHWMDYPTVSERMNAFMHRRQLAENG